MLRQLRCLLQLLLVGGVQQLVLTLLVRLALPHCCWLCQTTPAPLLLLLAVVAEMLVLALGPVLVHLGLPDSALAQGVPEQLHCQTNLPAAAAPAAP
jgi:hypothetical protein